MLEAKIIDRGRGPEIAGSRITVYDVLDYLKEGWPAKEIAWLFHLNTAQVDAAVLYIEAAMDSAHIKHTRRPRSGYRLLHGEKNSLTAEHSESHGRSRRSSEGPRVEVRRGG